MPRVRPVIVVAALIAFAAGTAEAATESVVERDRRRIQAHLKEVEAELRSRDVSHLSPAERRARERNLDRLHKYWKQGVFPHNDVTDSRTPIFIDDDGRDCAVAHLMQESGWEREARNIAECENLERLPDMESPEVEAWVKQSGLTAAEATMIQPGYDPCNNCDCTVDPVCGTNGKTYINHCTAIECADLETTASGCCDESDDPIEPREADPGWGTCGSSPDDAGADDAGAPDDGSTNATTVCSDRETTDPPSESACSLAGSSPTRAPLLPCVLVLSILALVRPTRRRDAR